MRNTKAMTLLELLTVISATVMLICIVLPCTRTLRDMGKTTACMTNLGNFNRAVLLYAEGSGGHLPVYQHERVTHDAEHRPGGPSTPSGCNMAFAGGVKDPGTGLLSEAYGFGLLYAQGLMGPPELFYCPAPKANQRYMLSYYPRPWGSATVRGSTVILLGYLYNPWVEPVEDVWMGWTYEDRLILAQHPADRCLLTDLNWGLDVVGHFEANGKSATWNMSYPDGHVAGMTNPQLFSILAGGFRGALWEDYNPVIRPEMPGGEAR